MLSISETHLVIIHRWGGSPQVDWYPRLLELFSSKYPQITVHIPQMPDPSTPTITNWTNALEQTIQEQILDTTDAHIDLYLVGHSVGCQTIMRYLAKQESTLFEKHTKLRLRGILFVAAWMVVDNSWETLLPWLTPFDVSHFQQRVKMLKTTLHGLVSDNDRFTKETMPENKKKLEQELGITLFEEPNQNHFNDPQCSAVEYIVKLLCL